MERLECGVIGLQRAGRDGERGARALPAPHELLAGDTARGGGGRRAERGVRAADVVREPRMERRRAKAGGGLDAAHHARRQLVEPVIERRIGAGARAPRA
jgi:hypothetical protein